MDRKAVAVIGGAVVDVLVTPAGPEVFQSGSYPAENIKMTFGGDALNEATVLSALGKKVYLHTVLGTDPQGDMIREHCRKHGIRLSGACSKEGTPTGINVVLVQENGERNFLTNRNGTLRKLGPEDLPRSFPKEAGILSFASLFVSSELGPEDYAAVFRTAKEQGMTVCADMTKRKNGETAEDIQEALACVDYLFPNEEEAYLLTGACTPEEAAAVFRRFGVGTPVIKCGKKGCYVLEGAEGYYVPALPDAACLDTTGAGDSFAAGFVYGLSENWDARRCAGFANACGAKAVSCIGATAWCGEGERILFDRGISSDYLFDYLGNEK